jgi:hypothetical protein
MMPEDPPHVRTVRKSALVYRPFFRGAAITMALGLVVFMTVHRFLAVSRPTGEGILVVEGWIPSESLRDAAHVFQGGSYRYLVVVGGPLDAADAVAKDRIVRIALPPTSADRTFATAKAFKQWLLSSGETICCVDVYTVGVHARKSWITFQSVLGGTYKTGVIAGPELSYKSDYWPASPRGLWLVARNLSGYLYSKCRILLRVQPE